MPPNANDIVKTLRGLLNSAQNGLTTKQLMRDFREMEGCVVPYQALGYSSFVQFLTESNEFDLMNTPDGPHVFAKVTKESAHIAELVGRQNRIRKKKSNLPARPPVRPQRFNRPANNYSNSYSSYSHNSNVSQLFFQ